MYKYIFSKMLSFTLSNATIPIIAIAVIGVTLVIGSILKSAREAGASRVEITHLLEVNEYNRNQMERHKKISAILEEDSKESAKQIEAIENERDSAIDAIAKIPQEESTEICPIDCVLPEIAQ